MQLDLNELEVPRNRVAIIDTIMLSYQVAPAFHKRIKSILSLAGISTKDSYDIDYLVARDVLLLGEALVVDDVIIDPKTFRVKLVPKGGGKILFSIDDELVSGDIKYYIRRASLTM